MAVQRQSGAATKVEKGRRMGLICSTVDICVPMDVSLRESRASELAARGKFSLRVRNGWKCSKRNYPELVSALTTPIQVSPCPYEPASASYEISTRHRCATAVRISAKSNGPPYAISVLTRPRFLSVRTLCPIIENLSTFGDVSWQMFRQTSPMRVHHREETRPMFHAPTPMSANTNPKPILAD